MSGWNFTKTAPTSIPSAVRPRFRRRWAERICISTAAERCLPKPICGRRSHIRWARGFSAVPPRPNAASWLTSPRGPRGTPTRNTSRSPASIPSCPPSCPNGCARRRRTLPLALWSLIKWQRRSRPICPPISVIRSRRPMCRPDGISSSISSKPGRLLRVFCQRHGGYGQVARDSVPHGLRIWGQTRGIP